MQAESNIPIEQWQAKFLAVFGEGIEMRVYYGGQVKTFGFRERMVRSEDPDDDSTCLEALFDEATARRLHAH